MTDIFDKGDLVRVSVAFTNASAVATDPTTVTFTYKVGLTGTETAYVYGTDAELVKDSVGNYHVDLTVAQDDVWYYTRFEGTGSLVAADENLFRIRSSYFG